MSNVTAKRAHRRYWQKSQRCRWKSITSVQRIPTLTTAWVITDCVPFGHQTWCLCPGLVSFGCLTSTEARRPIRDGDEWERGTEERNLETGANPEDQGCRGPPPEQNVMAVSVRHCAATTAPRNCCPNCYVEQSHKDNVRSSAVGETVNWSKRSPTLQPSTTSLLLISSGLASSWESSSPPSSWSRLDSDPGFLIQSVTQDTSLCVWLLYILRAESAVAWYCQSEPLTFKRGYLPQSHERFKRKRKNIQSPGETKRREVSCTLTKKQAQKRSRAGRWRWAGGLDFFCFSCFPTAELRTLSLWLFYTAVGTAIAWCCGRCEMPDGHCLNILLFWRRSTAFRVGACLEVSLRLLSPFSHSFPSLIGLLASVDVKHQNLLFIMTQRHNLQIFGVIPFVKLLTKRHINNS